MQLHTLAVHQLSKLIQGKEISSAEVTKDYLEHLKQIEEETRAFVTVAEEEALARARDVDQRLARGEELSALAGIPVAVSDNICTDGIRTTCASKMLHNFIPPYDATVVTRLKTAGAVIIGKCNLDEFGIGSSTENSAFFSSRNPFNPAAVPGGACGGSAAAVAAGEAAFALGTDTCGDIRQPAAFCGVIGLKPTYGYVSRNGLISYASSLDQIGPLTRDMTDLALALNVICGYDAMDSTSIQDETPDFKNYLINDVQGLKIGVPTEYFKTETAPGVAAKLREAVSKLEELGAVCAEVTLPHIEYAPAAHYIISSAEASSNLARYDGVRYGLRVEAEDVLSMFKKTRSQGFGAEVKRRLLLGTHVLSADNYADCYVKALQIRTLIKQDFERALEEFDCILTPTSPTVAFKFGEKADDPLAMYLSNIYTLPANMTGLPAMSLPFGMADGLPVGLQFIARPFDEKTLLRVGYTLEQNTDQTKLQPGLSR